MPGRVSEPAGQVCGYLGPCVGWGLRKDQVLAAAPSLAQAVAPLAVTVAVAGLALKALGLFPTRGAAGVIRVLGKENKPHTMEMMIVQRCQHQWGVNNCRLLKDLKALLYCSPRAAMTHVSCE